MTAQSLAVAAPIASTPPRPPGLGQVLTRSLRSVFAGTPGRMRRQAVISILACLIFGVFAFVAATAKADALSTARSDAAQLVRIQAIRISLVTADANLTNAFLVGGLEPPAQRAAYEDAIAVAAQTLEEAAGASKDDAAPLSAINDVVTRYTGLVESARANNRQGYPIGAAYLRQATTLLRTDALPSLTVVSQSEQKRIDSAYSDSAHAVYWLVAGIVIALVALIAAQVVLNRATRRVFNLPLLIATGLVLIIGLVVVGTMAWSQSKAASTRKGAYFTTLELATARTNAFDAKSAESLTLIARGSGQAYEARYQSLVADTRAILEDEVQRERGRDDSALTTFEAYDRVHKQVRKLDNAGSHTPAVDLATSTVAKGSNATFAQFDAASNAALKRQSAQARNELGSARSPLIALGWVALVAGVGAAVAAWLGVSARLREYR